jgi:dATP pyrophosphohydrolase
MARAPFQVLVFPYHVGTESYVQYAMFLRSDEQTEFWQGIAGGGEDDECPLQAARRESFEEAGISENAHYLELQTVNSVPVTAFQNVPHWSRDLYVIPEYCFGVEVQKKDLIISNEHTEYRWLTYARAVELLRFEGNRTALWELDQRLRKRDS